MKRTYKSTDRYHNYGHLINFFCGKSNNWVLSTDKEVDLSDKNTESKIKHYIDGSEFMTIKSLFLDIIGDRKIVLFEERLKKNITYPCYLKPSHAYIGGGKYIYYLKDNTTKIPVEINTSLNYFFDPAIKNHVTDDNNRMWDCRTFGILYLKQNILSLYLCERGFARFETSPNFTNLSLLENSNEIKNYIQELSEPLVKLINKEILKEFKEKFINYFYKNSLEEESFVILGFDTMFSSSDSKILNPSSKMIKNLKVNFIEINDSPVLVASKETIEGIITYDIFEQLIENILLNKKVNEKILKLVYTHKITNTKKPEISTFKFYDKKNIEKHIFEIRNKKISATEII